MLQDFYVDNFIGRSGLILLLLRQSIWSRRTRDFLLTDDLHYEESAVEADSGRSSVFCRMTGGKGTLTILSVHKILNSTGKNADGMAARRLCDSMDFRELCRIFGERFSRVASFELRCELSFRSAQKKVRQGVFADNMLSYMRVEILCERIYEEDRVSFFELVRYRGGDNFHLYWDQFPDVMLHFTDGNATGCNVFMRGLSVYDIQSDGIAKDVQFALILPTITAFSRIAAAQFDYIIPFSERLSEPTPDTGERFVWADPDGIVRYTGIAEGLETWLGCLSGTVNENQEILIRTVLTAAPGETLIVSEEEMIEGLADFFGKQELVYKKIMQL